MLEVADLRHVLARVPEVEVEGAGGHEAALGAALVLHRHQLADVRLEIQIRRILFLTISVQYFLTSSNTDSLTAFSDSVTAWSRVCSRVHRDPEGLDEGDQLLRVQVSQRGVHQHRDTVEDNNNDDNTEEGKNQTCKQCLTMQWATMSSQARWQYQARSHLEHIFW